MGSLLTYEMKIKRINEMEDEDKGRKGIAVKVNEEDQTCSSKNEDEIDEDEDEIDEGKKPTFKKGEKSSSLFKARCFECNSTDHLVVDCPKAIEKEKGALEAKFERLKKKKEGKGLIETWDQDSSESEGEEKVNMYFMAFENEVQSSPSNLSNFVDDDDS
ncbi:hypothetical protein M9H77_06762 [Catharanthus roseus]|uniref:Uncharacterized protein n=1 Tax=Catharanthus roseus TaxID=4058 RepID=A0ACC0BTA7_CATRO|nr:hypothetical protein M9H77_06762 [Catharanthus roseus]